MSGLAVRSSTNLLKRSLKDLFCYTVIMQSLIGDYESFIKNVSEGLNGSGINKAELSMLDHLCYRVETQERYEDTLEKLKGVANLLGEALISGRNIATFELNEYLEADGWIVPYLELPAPKYGSPYPEGLEHAEFVVVGGLEKFAQRHIDLSFNTNGMDKKVNPELGLKTDDFAVKFHEQPLGAVVRIEQRLGIS